MQNILKGSWRTNVAGIGTLLTGLGALCAAFAGETIDFKSVAAAGAAVMAGIGLLSARDNKVSSEEVGAK